MRVRARHVPSGIGIAVGSLEISHELIQAQSVYARKNGRRVFRNVFELKAENVCHPVWIKPASVRSQLNLSLASRNVDNRHPGDMANSLDVFLKSTGGG